MLCVLLVLIGFFVLPDLGGRAAAPAPAALSSSVLGRPALSASFVNRVLAAYHSPAVGTGQALYDLSLRYGIADEYALAFFLHESAFGTTGVARVTRSLGNIRCSDGYRCIAGYRVYATWQAGYEDWFKLIKFEYVTGQVSRKCPCVTIQQIIPIYAPASDHNNESAYMAAILSAVAAWRSGQVVV
jgi:hypothetical protein